jgi:NDP-sugar pyrophosphorylase family protein
VEHAVRNAFVLGAGLGTRLRPLTEHKPKPLIPVCNKPLIAHAFDILLAAGIENIVVNTHHCAEAYAEAFPDGQYSGCNLHFRHEPVLLETGGGIKNVEDLLGEEPFVVYNGDILSDIPVTRAIEHHLASDCEVTLVLRSSGGPLQISLDETSGRVVDIRHSLGSGIEPGFLFTGIYVVNPDFLARLPEQTKISVVPIFLEMIRSSASIGGFVLDEGHWWDLGNRDAYLSVHQALATIDHNGGAPWIHPAASVDPTARIEGASAIGPGCVVGANAIIGNSIFWENASSADGSRISGCIVAANTRVEGEHSNKDLVSC